MGVRPAGVLRLGRRRFEPWELLVMAAAPGMGPDPGAALEWVHSAVAEGADIVEVPGVVSVAPFVATVRDAYPELVIGVRTGSGEVAREACAAGADLLSGPLAEVAAEFGVGVVGSLAGAARAVRAGVAAERVIVEGSRPVADLVASGWPVLVSLSDPDLAGDLARAAVCGWLGARVFRIQRVLQTRRALSMVSAIRGDIPPAYAVRGLA
ncbi:MAG TPA: dihydropteroate synthase [Streptosporangiaceae bacterium]|nr:dihydropteroate synthase [Streptosporangiaceae bacterium]